MSNYTQSTFFAPKDSLTPGDPLKVIKGADIDPEFSAISDAIATKVDTAATGLVITSTTIDYDIDALTNVTPTTSDEFVIADASDGGDAKAVTVSALNGVLAHDSLSGVTADEHIAHSGVTITAGNGLSGGGTIAASRTIDLDLNELGTETTIASGDYIAMVDITDNGSQKITRANLNSSLVHDSLSGFVANEHINHTSVSITAGTGLTGGGTIAATRTLNLDISGLSSMTAAPAAADTFLYNDGGTMKQMSYNQVALPSNTDANAHTFTSADVGTIRYYTGTGGHTWTMDSGVGQNNGWIIVVNSGSGDVTFASGTATVSGAGGTTLSQNGIAVLIRESSTQWFVGGTGLA